MSTPEPEPDAYEQPLKRVKMRAGYEGDDSEVSVAGREPGAVNAKALVMGIQNYGGTRRLKNTLNDANAVAQTFVEVGFDVHKYTDETAEGGKVSYAGMVKVIQDFVDEVDENTVAVLAFMGKSSLSPAACSRMLSKRSGGRPRSGAGGEALPRPAGVPEEGAPAAPRRRAAGYPAADQG